LWDIRGLGAKIYNFFAPGKSLLRGFLDPLESGAATGPKIFVSPRPPSRIGTNRFATKRKTGKTKQKRFRMRNLAFC